MKMQRQNAVCTLQKSRMQNAECNMQKVACRLPIGAGGR